MRDSLVTIAYITTSVLFVSVKLTGLALCAERKQNLDRGIIRL